MKPVLVDSNVILDLTTEDPKWCDWSSEMLATCADEAELVINPLIYSEASIGFQTIEEVEDILSPGAFRRESLPWEAAFLVGKCFLKYRRAGGRRRSPLPDFYIGAHAAIKGYRLLSRDARRYRTYFPRLDLLAPDFQP